MSPSLWAQVIPFFKGTLVYDHALSEDTCGVTRSSGCGMAVERYITLPVSCINFLLLSATFLVYLRFHRVSSTVGILLSHILICLQYSIVCILCVAFEFLVVHEVILNTKLVHDLIAWTIQDASQNAVYLSGALLAVDRVLIMAFPVRYSFLKITKKLAAANFLLFFLNAAVVAVTLVLDQKDLRRLRAQLQDAYKIIFLAEIFLHFVFLVQTWRYSKRAANSQMKKKMMQTNQITLFQMGALLTVGLFPKVLYAVDHYFLHERLEDDLQIYWQANMYMVDRMFFSFHELLTAAFTLFKLSHNARVLYEESVSSLLSLFSLVASALSFIAYLRTPRTSPLVGMLLAHILSCSLFSVVNLLCLSAIFIYDHTVPSYNLVLLLLHSTFVYQTVARPSVYVSAVFLAVDRVLLLAFPIRYKQWRVSFHLALLTSLLWAIHGALALLVIFTQVISQYRTSYYLMRIYSAVFLLEIVLHSVFLFKYWRHAKSQKNVLATAPQLINHVTLFQMVTLTAFCILPNAVEYLDIMIFKYALTSSMKISYAKMERLSFSLNVLLVSAFTLSKLLKKPKAKVFARTAKNPHNGT
ncbi:hypothetical protein QR680_008891 [Steinernema hermaphroditum]|uniref:G-protein coupled receptors family 1 profile domain-containing protein n=1 Tax=Steinernema hermaphroditum TaxID=289476 RepID=A0AA39M7W1_9BILA|nr:hypothetical protein QR680_008891 [Steinernema hermaphroditum]